MRVPVTFRHQFVEFIPGELEEGMLYISMRFGTVSHRCACGCGSKVVTPLRPADWKLIFDGKTVSLYPSIGNQAFACRSHYWIRNNRVHWVEDWSDARNLGNDYGRSNKAGHFEAILDNDNLPEAGAPAPVKKGTPPTRLWHKLFDRVTGGGEG